MYVWCLYVHVWCLYVHVWCPCVVCGVHVLCVVSMCCVWCPCAVCGVHVLCVVSMCCVWCPCAVCGVHVLCVVSMCCNSCPFVTLPLLVLLHKSCVPHQLTHDAHNMTYAQYYMYHLSILWPFFPLLLIYFNDLQLLTITYQHRIAQYLHI